MRENVALKVLQHLYGDILQAPLSINNLIYADDTLLIDNSAESVQKYMEVIISVGMEYGLEINWDKVDVLGVRCHPKLQQTNGTCIQQKDSIQYLGALISADGCIQSELNRRIGMAASDFKVLHILWTHTDVSNRKNTKYLLRAFSRNCCTVSKQVGSQKSNGLN